MNVLRLGHTCLCTSDLVTLFRDIQIRSRVSGMTSQPEVFAEPIAWPGRHQYTNIVKIIQNHCFLDGFCIHLLFVGGVQWCQQKLTWLRPDYVTPRRISRPTTSCHGQGGQSQACHQGYSRCLTCGVHLGVGAGGRARALKTKLGAGARDHGVIEWGVGEAGKTEGDRRAAALGGDHWVASSHLHPRAIRLHRGWELQFGGTTQGDRLVVPILLAGRATPHILHGDVQLDSVTHLTILAGGTCVTAPGPVPQADVPLQIPHVHIPWVIVHANHPAICNQECIHAQLADAGDSGLKGDLCRTHRTNRHLLDRTDGEGLRGEGVQGVLHAARLAHRCTWCIHLAKCIHGHPNAHRVARGSFWDDRELATLPLNVYLHGHLTGVCASPRSCGATFTVGEACGHQSGSSQKEPHTHDQRHPSCAGAGTCWTYELGPY